LVGRWEKFVEKQGDYVEEWCILFLNSSIKQSCKIWNTSGRQEDTQWGPQADPWAGSDKANSQASWQAPENEWEDIVEKLAHSQIKEETVDSLHTGAVGSLATFVSSVPTNWKMKWWHTYRLLRTRSLKVGAMWHDYIVSCVVVTK
jgi:hypothetical protein